jgi:hypothetical protein
VTLDCIRRHTDELPFTVRLGRKVRFSAVGLDRYSGSGRDARSDAGSYRYTYERYNAP